MATFQYKARTRSGEMVTGTVEAEEHRLAVAELGRLGYFPLTVEAAQTQTAWQTAMSDFRRGLSRREMLMLTQQLSSLLRSGMSLAQALEVLERRAQKPSVRGLLSALHGSPSFLSDSAHLPVPALPVTRMLLPR